MQTAQRNVIWFATIVLLLFLSWFTISPGTPKVYAPINLLVWLAVGLILNLLGIMPVRLIEHLVNIENACFFVGVVFVPVLFCVWCIPILRGSAKMPTRSIILFVCTTVLSMFWLAFGYSYGIQYQSVEYVKGVFIINVIWWTFLSAFALVAWRYPSAGHNLAFHVTLFAWLAWYAFPYLGELP